MDLQGKRVYEGKFKMNMSALMFCSVGRRRIWPICARNYETTELAERAHPENTTREKPCSTNKRCVLIESCKILELLSGCH